MKKITILSAIILTIGSAKSQALFEFNNRHLSQSHLWNPGFMPQYKATLSTGQTYFSAGLVGTTLNGLFGSTETPIQTVSRMIGEDEKQLGIDIYQQSDLFHFGFRSKKSYFSINSTVINEGAVRVPKDLLGLAFLGNGAFIENDADIDFSGNRLRSYLKNTFSYGRFLSNELSVGFNASLINGITDLNIEKARFGIGTDTGTASIYSLRLNGAITGRASLLGVDVQTALNDSNYDAQEAVLDQLNQIQLGTNQGYAFGFGAVYRLNEKFRFSLAVQNLGSIVWNLGAQEIKMNESEWIWNGLDTNQIDNIDDDLAQQLQDTFLNKFDIRGSSIESYTSVLKPRYTLGAEFLIFPRTHLQAFGGYGFGINGDKTFISTNLHQELGEWIDLRVGYSLYDVSNPTHRVGLGLSLNLGPLQVFGSINDILGIVNYGSAQVTSGMFGVNINIGRRKDRDYDEVPDKRDSCYKTFGVISNNGCPYGFLGGSMTYMEEEDATETFATESVESAEESSVESSEIMEVKNNTLTKEQTVEAPMAASTDPEIVEVEVEEIPVDLPMETTTESKVEESSEEIPTETSIEGTTIPVENAELDSIPTPITDTTSLSLEPTITELPNSNALKESNKKESPKKGKAKSKALKSDDLEELMKR